MTMRPSRSCRHHQRPQPTRAAAKPSQRRRSPAALLRHRPPPLWQHLRPAWRPSDSSRGPRCRARDGGRCPRFRRTEGQQAGRLPPSTFHHDAVELVNSPVVALAGHIYLRVAHKAGGGGYGKETRPHHGRGAAAAACVHSTCSCCCRLRPPTAASARRQPGRAGGGLRPPSCCSYLLHPRFSSLRAAAGLGCVSPPEQRSKRKWAWSFSATRTSSRAESPLICLCQPFHSPSVVLPDDELELHHGRGRNLLFG